jgi:hypothetical protein
MEMVLSHDKKYRNSKQSFRHIFRSFTAQFVEDKRPIQLQNSGSVMATAHGNSLAEIHNYFVESHIHGRFQAKKCEKRPVKADSHIACHAHAVPMPLPCHAVR